MDSTTKQAIENLRKLPKEEFLRLVEIYSERDFAKELLALGYFDVGYLESDSFEVVMPENNIELKTVKNIEYNRDRTSLINSVLIPAKESAQFLAGEQLFFTGTSMKPQGFEESTEPNDIYSWAA